MHARPGKNGERGSILITFALFFTLLLAFAAFATEGGRWYLVRAELSKSVDAGALEGAKNISNPYASAVTIAQDFCAENFSNGYLGTPGSGTGTASFSAQMVGTDKVLVNGNASAGAILGKILGFDLIPVSSSGAAALKKVEIMLILDRSGSMSGQKIADLKTAASSFVDFFVSTQSQDKMGLVSFSTAVRVDRALGTNYVTAMKSAISAMSANGWTNSEDAIDQADGPGGFTDQTGVPSDARVQQVAIFFSDGFPTAYRSAFKYKNLVYDGVVAEDLTLSRPDNAQSLGIPSTPTGDGVFPSSKCGLNVATTRWYAFDTYPVAPYAPDACKIPPSDLTIALDKTASAMAIAKAKQLKDAGITVFAIGLGSGTDINPDFLKALASTPDQVFIAPTSSDLAALFAYVAQQIKLRLVA